MNKRIRNLKDDERLERMYDKGCNAKTFFPKVEFISKTKPDDIEGWYYDKSTGQYKTYDRPKCEYIIKRTNFSFKYKKYFKHIATKKIRSSDEELKYNEYKKKYFIDIE